MRAQVDLFWRMFNPACATCGGRYLRVLRARKDLPVAKRTEWMQSVVEHWSTFGHSEPLLRELMDRNWSEWKHHDLPWL